MNTRVQVEHPVTEMVTGVDLVEAADPRGSRREARAPRHPPVDFRGHAIECRINAEDPQTFAPWPGLITEYYPPGGTGVRVDSGVYGGWRVPPHYDSLIAKVIVHAPTREEAIAACVRARRVHRRRDSHEHRCTSGCSATPRSRRQDDDAHDRADHRAGDLS